MEEQKPQNQEAQNTEDIFDTTKEEPIEDVDMNIIYVNDTTYPYIFIKTCGRMMTIYWKNGLEGVMYGTEKQLDVVTKKLLSKYNVFVEYKTKNKLAILELNEITLLLLARHCKELRKGIMKFLKKLHSWGIIGDFVYKKYMDVDFKNIVKFNGYTISNLTLILNFRVLATDVTFIVTPTKKGEKWNIEGPQDAIRVFETIMRTTKLTELAEKIPDIKYAIQKYYEHLRDLVC